MEQSQSRTDGDDDERLRLGCPCAKEYTPLVYLSATMLPMTPSQLTCQLLTARLREQAVEVGLLRMAVENRLGLVEASETWLAPTIPTRAVIGWPASNISGSSLRSNAIPRSAKS